MTGTTKDGEFPLRRAIWRFFLQIDIIFCIVEFVFRPKLRIGGQNPACM
jgi:hypothetical protein